MLKEEVKLEAGEVIDASGININNLNNFFQKEIQDCKVGGTNCNIATFLALVQISIMLIVYLFLVHWEGVGGGEF